ncbi:MAG: ATP-dependent RecD-like DNA helicase [Bacilli bacterium]|nr:ATP-dependent RecD-like DNA helicase [Bacilli bacterium]
MKYIKGNFRKTIFKNETGYTIGLFKVKETDDEEVEVYINRVITYTGYFHDLNEDDTFILYGNLVNHDKYGEQFQVEKYERLMPEEKDSIIEFLSSGLFKGIGEAKAKKIVDYLGKDTLQVILNNPSNLLLIPTITKKQVDILHTKLVEYEASYSTILRLNDLGFSTKDSLLIYNKYKEKTNKIIDDNLYLIIEDIEDITFKKIDYIMLKQNISKDDIRRIKASILYIMNEICNTYGHLYLYKEEIFSYIPRVLNNNISSDEFDISIEELIKELKVIEDEECYYTKQLYDAQTNIINRFSYLSKQEEIKEKKIDKYLTDLEKYNNIEYNNDQKEAIKKAIENKFLIITGGPGTGKTTIIKAITDLYKNLNDLNYEKLSKELVLLAPTGRASKRISESTLLPALTIHRFLKWNKDNNKFAVNEFNKSDAKFVIIDESSMVDINLMDNLLKGLSYNTKIILVGDYNQLPSVGPGEILKDLIDSDSLPIKKLNQLYRQGEDSNIINLAYEINNGILNNETIIKNKDLEFIETNPILLKEELINICKNYIDYDYKQFQILVPMYKTINGIDEINIALQKLFNPKNKIKKEIIINGIIYRENDKVIQLTNMPEENVFNGDIGIIERIDNNTKKEIYINFDGNLVKYTAANFNKFKHGYAISIHKSQGSEFDITILPIVKSYGKMLYRKLIYTAVTRSKKKLYIIGEVEALKIAIKNNENDVRRSKMSTKIIEHLK